MQVKALDGAILDVKVQIHKDKYGKVAVELITDGKPYKLSTRVSTILAAGEFAVNTKDMPVAEHFLAQLNFATNTGKTVSENEHIYPIYVINKQTLGTVQPRPVQQPVKQKETKKAKNSYYPIAEARYHNGVYFFDLSDVQLRPNEELMLRPHYPTDASIYGLYGSHTITRVVPNNTKDK